MVAKSEQTDYYETLQISPNADADTIQRVFRLLAQRFHPDNKETGDADRFRALHEAYSVLSVPDRRAQYDVHHQALRQGRWRFAATATSSSSSSCARPSSRSSTRGVAPSRTIPPFRPTTCRSSPDSRANTWSSRPGT